MKLEAVSMVCDQNVVSSRLSVAICANIALSKDWDMHENLYFEEDSTHVIDRAH